ncbi:MAG: 3-hydroxyacyl-CoA dehydrogenase family protein [Planctomycetaceae bacterium]|nr:3-hydroxyacyl-CoA dehydrogenase family protein [Planctomycetaceae bacterium]
MSDIRNDNNVNQNLEPGVQQCPVGVVGLGLLGRGIAVSLLSSGFPVVGVTRTEEEIAAALPPMEAMIEELVEMKCVPAELREGWRSRFLVSTDLSRLKPCRLVIESVTEDLAVKQDVFDRIETIVAEDAVIASNTSAIPISLLQQTRRLPERFVGMHWAEPAHCTRFLELIRGETTSEATLEAVVALGRQLGKDPTICQQDIPGFIVNRLAYALYREALSLVEQGVADVETIDRSVRNTLGLWATTCGPFRWIDVSGGPALYARAMERVLPTLSRESALPPLLAELAAADARGIMNGRGFYEYTEQEREHWEDRQRRHAWLVKYVLDTEFPLSPAGSD